MPVDVPEPHRATWIFGALLLVALLGTLRRAPRVADALPPTVSQELKGLAILAIVFAHVSFMLVSDYHFLWPLSLGAGVGVDLFLLLSGYGLTVAALERPLAPLAFWRRRLERVFVPLWIALAGFFLADTLLLGYRYPAAYVLQSFLGIFPSAIPTDDVNSPYWYISWLLLFYVLFPLVFVRERPWVTALVLAAVANGLAILDPLGWQANWLHRLHTNAFPLGVLLAWALRAREGRPSPLAARVVVWREARGIPRYALLAACAAVAGYLSAHNEDWQWPGLSPLLEGIGFNAHFFVGQATSLGAMALVVLAFAVKRVEIGFLALVGEYSYEVYLLHWPLMARYDVFFRSVPAWLAMACWVGGFLALGWCVQRLAAQVPRPAQ